ncbi:TolC family protein [Rariglobus hedericola]|uniref:TolC family protein n=1 Tax=Rariglobus hedericola TaxID=2597822 RepID=A0A556QQ73_9BACT|nr:TolC family protein [Rariglobus hedericola]TSJ78794.1 TolC family protein [Rariglobus hedericola]
MKSVFSLSLALLAAPAIFAQQPAPAPVPDVPVQLDLRTAVIYAVENNFAIRQARERIKEQEGLIVEVKARALPNVAAVGSYTRNDEEISQSAPPSDQNWSIAIEARQALYAGGGIKSALDAQKVIREASLLELRSVINNALLEVRTRFFNVLLARETIKVQEQNVKLLEEQLTNAKNRFEAGSVSNFEVLRAEVELANAKPQLIRARNTFRTSTDQLRQSIGYINTTKENLRRTPEFVGTLEFTPASYDLQASLDSARVNRPELLRFAKIVQAQERNIDFAKSTYRPTLDLVGSYGLFKDTRSDEFDDSRKGWTVGVESNWAIFDGRATAGRVAQARSQARQAGLTLSEQTLAVEVEVRTALSSLQEAAELAEAAVKVVGQAEESVRLSDARYGAGSATQLDVLQAQVALTQARNNQLQANYSYNVALANLRRALGEPDVYLADPAAAK